MWLGRGRKRGAESRVRNLPLERLCAWPGEPSEELCASVAAHGLLRPLVVAPQGQGYIVLDGRRRYHAARRAGIERVPVVVVRLSPEEAVVLRRWHPELQTCEDAGSLRVLALLEEARRRGIIDGEDVIRLRAQAEDEVIASIAEVWRARQARAAEPPSPGAEPSAGRREGTAAPQAGRGGCRQAVEGLEDMFARIAVRGRINGAQVERFVQFLVRRRQVEPETFIEWRNTLPLDPVARNALLVCKMCIHMALGLKWTPLQVLRMGVAGLLHNVGLVALGWKPGPTEGLTVVEPIDHTEAGARLIREARTWGYQVQSVCLDHHERWNGRGEPRGKRGEEVDLPTRIAAFLDSFALLVNPWTGEGRTPREAYRCIEAMTLAEDLFDPGVLRAFALHFSKFPVGSIVRLPGGEIARVVGPNPIDPIRPRLRVLEPEARRGGLADLDDPADACEDLSLQWDASAAP